MLEYLLGMFPPDWSILPSLVGPLIETLWMAVVAIVLASAVALPLSFLAARNTTPHLLVYLVARGIINLARGLPTLLWALLYISMLGLGPPPGIAALVSHCIGSLGKYFSEAIETVSPETIETMEAMRVDGANEWQALYHGMIPIIAPLFTSYILYYFEWAVRVGIILGIVGAGGLGMRLLASIQLFRRQETMTVIIVILALVTMVDSSSRLIRARLRGMY